MSADRRYVGIGTFRMRSLHKGGFRAFELDSARRVYHCTMMNLLETGPAARVNNRGVVVQLDPSLYPLQHNHFMCPGFLTMCQLCENYNCIRDGVVLCTSCHGHPSLLGHFGRGPAV
jgi:hypothetical protein